MSEFDDRNNNSFDQLNLYDFTNSFFSIDLINTFRRQRDDVFSNTKDMFKFQQSSASFLTSSSWDVNTASTITEVNRLKNDSMKIKQLLWNTPQNSIDDFHANNTNSNNRMYSIPKNNQTYQDLRDIRVLPLSTPKKATNSFQWSQKGNSTTTTTTAAITNNSNKKIKYEIKLPKLTEQPTSITISRVASTSMTNTATPTNNQLLNTLHRPIIKKNNLILDVDTGVVPKSHSTLKARMEMRNSANRFPPVYNAKLKSAVRPSESNKIPIKFEDPRVRSMKNQLASVASTTTADSASSAPVTKEIKLKDKDTEITNILHKPTDKRTVLIYKRFNENDVKKLTSKANNKIYK